MEDTVTGNRRFEVPAATGEPFRPLFVRLTDERVGHITLLEGLAYGAGMRLWLFCDPF